MDQQLVVMSFHHIHHDSDGKHYVHHGDASHIHVAPDQTYTIKHCRCGLHSISVPRAWGGYKELRGEYEFVEPCPEGGWHIESGVPVVQSS